MAIYLIRHAQSTANINQPSASHQSIALSELGRIQALQLCEQLPVLDQVIISKFARSHETAQALLHKYQLRAEVDAHIHEFSYLSERRCQNTCMQDRKIWVDQYWEKMDIHYQDADDAESFATFYRRVGYFLERLEQLKYQNAFNIHHNTAVVSHGQFLALLRLRMQYPQADANTLMPIFRADLLQRPIGNIEYFIYPK